MYEKESKAMCFFLRHAAKDLKWDITKDGFISVNQLVDCVKGKKFPNFTVEAVAQIVREDEKGRYSYSEDGTKIRANQGHSFDVDLGLKAKIPPVILYHGTDSKAVPIIKKTGIQKMKRQHVHLADDPETAASVGIRHGAEILIIIDTRPMVADGVKFYQSTNGVWLTDFVDAKYLNEVNWR